ncbi:TPA: hypothetical protein QCJ32_003685 [Enterobacter asburiae]|uniref:hypothetical protein n=1 Tax=Enterobacter TaxID=547 RepID=UPI0007B388C6|nr:hypothetical protein [Enterobacter asburiae]KZR49957.1 hypothetical protein A3N68_08760 [Enterobacter asburiae]MBL5927233.1 hypothetical protein [Enterobacter asburiae]MBL5957972.1 hypothetical protein [Enterobacter asburiae]HDC4490235.1 hypothetical protein [Enterobacter asburiae]HDR2404064.1 hypothetical protein [Enterobacter asburiae]
MITTRVKLFLLLAAVWIAGIFATLLFGRLLIALVSFFFIGQFDFPMSDLVEATTLAISGGILIGGIQYVMAKEKNRSEDPPR